MEGYIKLHRKIIESKIWGKPSDWLKIWIYLLSKVFHQKGNTFNIGENFFKYEIIAQECNVSVRTVSNCVRWLQLEGQVVGQKQPRGVIIKLTNYSKYQNKGSNDSMTTSISSSITEGGSIREEGKEYTEELEKLLNFWNTTYNLKNRITINLESIYSKARKKFNKEEIKLGVNNYKNYIQKNDWVTHRFSLYDFLKQSNGLEKFINQ